MGKHHWKVEKQPEWYVKAVRKTIAALPGGYAEAADWLDVTENALFNRLRADGDQIFPLGWAMVLQRAAGTHHIADAVAQSAGGVFVSLPEIEEVENADINQRLLTEQTLYITQPGPLYLPSFSTIKTQRQTGK